MRIKYSGTVDRVTSYLQQADRCYRVWERFRRGRIFVSKEREDEFHGQREDMCLGKVVLYLGQLKKDFVVWFNGRQGSISG